MTIKSDIHGLAVQAARPFSTQVMSVTSSSAQSAAFQNSDPGRYSASDNTPLPTNKTLHIRLCSTADCWIAFGANPTASTGAGSLLLPASVPEYFWVKPGEKIAVIRSSADGVLSIAELVN